jgi:hypothetical protein
MLNELTSVGGEPRFGVPAHCLRFIAEKGHSLIEMAVFGLATCHAECW